MVGFTQRSFRRYAFPENNAGLLVEHLRCSGGGRHRGGKRKEGRGDSCNPFYSRFSTRFLDAIRGGEKDTVMGKFKILLLSLVLVSIASVGCGRRAAGTNAKAAPLMAAAVSGVGEIQNRSREWSAM